MNISEANAALATAIGDVCDQIAAADQSSADMTEISTAVANSETLNLELVLCQGARKAAAQLSESHLDKLRRKVEVARKVYKFYNRIDFNPVSYGLLSREAFNQLCGLMLIVALQKNDARFLNSALKMIDGVVNLGDVDIDSDLVNLAHSTLDVFLSITGEFP